MQLINNSYAETFLTDNENLQKLLSSMNVTLDDIRELTFPVVKFPVTNFAEVIPNWGNVTFNRIGSSMIHYFTRYLKEQAQHRKPVTFGANMLQYLSSQVAGAVDRQFIDKTRWQCLRVWALSRYGAESKLEKMIRQSIADSVSMIGYTGSLNDILYDLNDKSDVINNISEFDEDYYGGPLDVESLMLNVLLRLVWVDEIIASFESINSRANSPRSKNAN